MAWSAFVEFLDRTVDILKFRTLIVCQKGLDKQCKPGQTDQGFSLFCYSDKYFENSSPDITKNLFENRKCLKFKTFTTLTCVQLTEFTIKLFINK